MGLWERPSRRERRGELRSEEASLAEWQWEEEASVSRWLVAWEKMEEDLEMDFYIIYADYLQNIVHTLVYFFQNPMRKKSLPTSATTLS